MLGTSWCNSWSCSGSTRSSSTTSSGGSGGILAEYSKRLAAGRLQPDVTQLAAVCALQALQDSLLQSLLGGQRSPAPCAAQQQLEQEQPCQQAQPRVQGAYLWGPVGSGKTQLMDLFLSTLPTAGDSEQQQQQPQQQQQHAARLLPQRLHFHTFMLGVHQQLHAIQQSLPRVVGRSREGLRVYRHALPPEDPVLLVARAAAAHTHLLCLDELHVTDVADAMLLARLLGTLLDCGCWVVLTSNRPPRELYKDGLSRKYFEPFIHTIDQRLLQLRVAGGRDYRVGTVHQAREGTAGAASGLWLIGPGSEQQLQQQWEQLAARAAPDHAPGAVSLPLPFGRSLHVPLAVRAQPEQQQQPPSQPGLGKQLAGACFTFEQLCGHGGSRSSLEHSGAVSANDLLALVDACDVLFLQKLPQLTPAHRDEARRLVTLIDCAYDAHTQAPGSIRLVVSAAVPPAELFLPLLSAAARQGVNPNLGRAKSDRLDMKQLLQVTPGAGGGDGSQPPGLAAERAAAAGGSPPQTALLAEEVLAYHRAASRLAELCTVVEAAA